MEDINVKKATIGQLSDIMRLFANGDYDREFAQALIEKRVEIRGEKCDRITVPDLSAAELIELVKEKLGLTYIDADLAECGKTYEVKVWAPGRRVVPSTEVRKHFMDGFVGNTSAFVMWVAKNNPEGYYASIPEDDSRFWHGGNLYAPFFIRDDKSHRYYYHNDVRHVWDARWSFVAFREVK